METIDNSAPPGNDDAARFRDHLAATGITPDLISRFQNIILSYYKNNGRDLPWRHTTDPYHILVSEIMLQQTRVDRVLKKYPEFITAFPASSDLAKAPLSLVLTVWQGMGYNRRAIALQACAKKMMQEYGGNLPARADILITFPGIGKATAGSILAFAFNRPAVFIETNIRRVFIHFFFAEREAVSDDEILLLVEQVMYQEDPRSWYSALMDYGTLLKITVPNPNRRSVHYTKQPKFEGSDREIRGIILKNLLKRPDLHEETLIRSLRKDPKRVRQIINSLEEEGFLVRSKRQLRINES